MFETVDRDVGNIAVRLDELCPTRTSWSRTLSRERSVGARRRACPTHRRRFWRNSANSGGTSVSRRTRSRRYHWKFHRPTGRTTGQRGRWCVRYKRRPVGRWGGGSFTAGTTGCGWVLSKVMSILKHNYLIIDGEGEGGDEIKVCS